MNGIEARERLARGQNLPAYSLLQMMQSLFVRGFVFSLYHFERSVKEAPD